VNNFVHMCCVGESHLNYRVLAIRHLLGDAQDFMREEFAKMEAHRQAVVAPAEVKYAWVHETKMNTAPLVGFIASWHIYLDKSELVNTDFSSDSGCWDRRKTRAVPPPRPRSIY
jgi:hypothetical protein